MLDPKSKSTLWPAENEAQILAFFKGKTDGFFVDIGAWNGFDLSNTRALWQMGWSGIMIEADSRSFAQLKENYGDDSRLKLIHAAVCDKDDTVIFHESRVPWASSMDPRWIEAFGFGHFSPVSAQGRRIESLGIPESFELLTIDVEGLDSLIIESMPPQMKPRLIVVEINKADGDKRIRTCLKSRGYHLVWGNALNAAYAL